MYKAFIKHFVSLLFLLQFTNLQAEAKSFEIKFPMYEDGRNWTKGYSEQDPLIAFTEYFLNSETKDNWSEIVTTQYFTSRYDFSLEDFFGNAIRELAKTFPKNKIRSRIIHSCPDSLTADWWIHEKTPNDQHEWVRIFKKDNRVGILRYTTKRMLQSGQRGKVWEEILSRAVFE